MTSFSNLCPSSQRKSLIVIFVVREMKVHMKGDVLTGGIL